MKQNNFFLFINEKTQIATTFHLQQLNTNDTDFWKIRKTD